MLTSKEINRIEEFFRKYLSVSLIERRTQDTGVLPELSEEDRQELVTLKGLCDTSTPRDKRYHDDIKMLLGKT